MKYKITMEMKITSPMKKEIIVKTMMQSLLDASTNYTDEPKG